MPEIFDCAQGSPEWFQARLGIPTASELKTVLAKGEGKTRKRYMRKLASEIILGEPHESYSNGHMERGKAMEEDARQLYAFAHDVEPRQVGFIKNGKAGCSPDSLIGDTGALEVKSALPEIVIEKIEAGKFPPEHKAQCQGVLWVAERESIDLVVYWPGMPLFEITATRDEDYIKALEAEVDRFNSELAELVERVRRYGAGPDRPVISHKDMMRQLSGGVT